jgi:CHAT domain-containing protein/tetratricopeptide (TPR) repeat protein
MLLTVARYAWLQGTAQESDAALPGINKSIQPALSKGQIHSYRITLESDQFARVLIDQSGIQNRPATTQDESRIAAERAFAAGERLRAEWSAESSRKAIRKFEEAVQYWQAAGEKREEANTLKTIGEVYHLLGKPQKALEHHDRALQLSQALSDRRLEGEILNQIGAVHIDLGKNQEALDYCTRALEINQAVSNRRAEAEALNNLGEVCHAFGNDEKGLEYYQQALPLWRALGDRRGEAQTLLYLGYTYAALDDTEKAFDYYRQSLRLYQTMNDQRGQALTLIAMGHLQSRLGHKQEALDNYDQAVPLIQRIGDRVWQGSILSGVAYVYVSLGDQDRALDNYSRALQNYRAANYRHGEATSLIAIGRIYYSRGEYHTALRYYGPALLISLTIADKAVEAFARSNIGMVHNALGMREKALDEHNRAFFFYREEKSLLGQAHVLYNIGYVYESWGEKFKALDYYSQALSLSREAGDRFGETATLHRIARMERDLGHITEARRHIEAALTLAETLRGEVASQDLRAAYLASVRDYHEFYIDLLMQVHQRQPSEGHDATALQASERARARSLLELLAEAEIDVREGIDPALKERERATQARLSSIQSQLIQVHAQASPDKTKIAQLEEVLKKAEGEREQLEMEIRQQHPRYAELQYPQPLGLSAIQALLDEQTALLEYALGQEASYLFAVTKNDFLVARLPASASFDRQVKWLRHILARSPRRMDQVIYLTQARHLYQQLIHPARRLLAGKPQLVIVPDGILYYLPFEVLLTSGEATRLARHDPNRWPYLIRQYAISYVPSASVLASLRRHQPETLREQRTFLAYADPVQAAQKPDENSNAAMAVRSAFGRAKPWKLERLRYTRQEVRQIARLYPDDQVALFLGEQASEENVKAEGRLTQYRFVHIAAHGLLNENKPQFSGLVLTLPKRPQTSDVRPQTSDRINPQSAIRNPQSEGPQSAIRNPQSEDGLLQVYEIFNLKLNADLVVLSACETGLGKEVKGEGLIGLTRAFLYAGTPSVVVSLWKVLDTSTADLMVRFYRQLKDGGLSKTEALQRAQLEMIRRGVFAHPHYWAPFILVGEGKMSNAE